MLVVQVMNLDRITTAPRETSLATVPVTVEHLAAAEGPLGSSEIRGMLGKPLGVVHDEPLGGFGGVAPESLITSSCLARFNK